jgi:hypothetical protein
MQITRLHIHLTYENEFLDFVTSASGTSLNFHGLRLPLYKWFYSFKHEIHRKNKLLQTNGNGQLEVAMIKIAPLD